MTLQELQNLDPQRIGSWPAPIRALVVLAICAAVLGAGYWYDTQDQMTTLERVKGQEGQLKTAFETKQRQAANLEPLKAQMKQIQQSFGELLRLLPNKTEIEGLLVEISQAGLASGLEFELFKPLPEQPQEFYAIQPIQIQVTGTYHEFGKFISAVAELPRIVTVHDISIRPTPGAAAAQKADKTKGKTTEQQAPSTQLTMTMVAKTYRYLEEEEIQAQEKSKKGKGKRR